jgi:superfamily II DNA or RNA helicase
MIFSETIDSIQQLRDMLESNNIPARTIYNGIKPRERQEILERWGIDYFPLLSVHTLEIGYDVPQVGIAIIIASTSNMNQVAQRIGRVVRKAEGKDQALVYVIHVRGTKDDNVLKVIGSAVDKEATTNRDQQEQEQQEHRHFKSNSKTKKAFKTSRGQKTITKFS